MNKMNNIEMNNNVRSSHIQTIECKSKLMKFNNPMISSRIYINL